MKRSLSFILLTTLLTASCSITKNSSSSRRRRRTTTTETTIVSTSTSDSTQTSVAPTSTSEHTSTSAPSSTAKTSSSTTTSKTTATSQSSKTSAPTTTSITSSSSQITSSSSPALHVQTIGEIKTEKKVGKIVCFDATYLRCLTWTNEDLMYFADAHDTIWLRVPYANYTGYLANRYRGKEYRVTAKLAETENGLEVVYDSSLTVEESVTNLGDDYPLSYNSETTPIEVSGISEIKAKSGQIVLNNKGHGAGELVKFTSQIVQTEYTDANKKAMVLDADGNTITVIGDGKKMVDKNDIGKFYTWIGIISIQTSVPAILGYECKYVSHTAEEEEQIDVSKATEVSPSYFAKWNLTSSKYNPASNDDYYKLYKATGYVVDNSDITTSFNFGMVDNYGGSLSDSGSTSTVKGFYIVNCTKLDDDDLQYCPVIDYVGQNTPLEVYFSIRDYDTQNHIWKMMVIEGLIPELS